MDNAGDIKIPQPAGDFELICAWIYDEVTMEHIATIWPGPVDDGEDSVTLEWNKSGEFTLTLNKCEGDG